MKEKLLNNIGLKILSFVLAAMLWVVIMTIEDPNTTRRLSSVEVNVLNEDSINALDKVYEIQSGDRVEIILSGKDSIVGKVKSEDFKVTADLSELTPPWDSVKIQVSCPAYDHLASSQLSYSLGKTNVMKVTIEDKVSANFPVQIEMVGEAAVGYTVGDKKTKPNMVEISGGKSQIEKIDKVQVRVNISGATENVKEKVAPVAYDANGNALDSNKLEFSNSQISVNVNLLRTKSVPLTVTTEGTPALGYAVTQLNFAPEEEVLISGSEADLSKINSISIPVDVSGRTTNLETEEEIANYLPEGIRIADKTTAVSINIVIEPKEQREFILLTSQIAILNAPEQYQIKYQTPNNSNLMVRLMGESNIINKLTSTDINASIDLKDLKAGSHNLKVTVEVPEGVMVVTSPTMTVELVEENAEAEATESPQPVPTENPTEEPTPEPTPEPVPTTTPEAEATPPAETEEIE